jgi:hypothetical protein
MALQTKLTSNQHVDGIAAMATKRPPSAAYLLSIQLITRAFLLMIATKPAPTLKL